jgi:hypothetical protein
LEGVASRVHSFGGEGISVCAVSTSSEASITFVHFELERSHKFGSLLIAGSSIFP